ncbi:MAG: sugar ABC transporter ATP-binding protein, partial [candidate division Zixibacteria bacterium]|nr:sugar ABC transporter ATP-binding protein [candidate division Zixibacteria bacterium]
MNADPARVAAPAMFLQMREIAKAFPGVQAVKSGSFELAGGEIHALVGENGAGKSTLIKILTGAHQADAGDIILNGTLVTFDSPIAARHAGIAAIYQEFTLIPTMTVRENLFLGREKTRRGFIDASAERQTAAAVLARLGLDIDPESLVADLSTAHQQLVEIARALLTDAKILVMDEPTAAITPREVEKLFGILKELAGRGIGIIFISHRLDEIFAVADRVTVMRDGDTIGTWKTSELTRNTLIEHMVGRSLEEEFPKVAAQRGEICFEVNGLCGGKIRDVSFSVRRGEVLGLAGLMGAGRTETARLIFGADKKESGDIRLDGRTLDISSPREAIAGGICLLTEDRKMQGLVLKASALENFALPNLLSWSKGGFINRRKERSRFFARVDNLNIRLSGPDQHAEDLSGGNQQKLLVARWLETDSKVVIFDEPTRGIDVGAKYEMYLLINDLAAQGKVIIMISSELPEI